jgi:hypothetical protein
LRAEAPTASFDEGKQLIVLKGDGRAPAVLRIQNRPGEPTNPVSANFISYSLATGLPDFSGFQGAEITLPNGTQNQFGPAATRTPPGPPR